MKFKIKIIFFMIFISLFTVIFQSGYSIKADAAEITTDINIISDTDILPDCAKEWARRRGATDEFINLAPLYFKYAKEHGNINPAVAYAQSALETGYGKFGSLFGADSHNPCGMKMTQGGGDFDPKIHMRFKTWDDGIKAHLDHLALYGGASGYPLLSSNTNDPRHFKELYGKCKTVKSLGGCYAPSPTYGDSVLELYNSLVQVDKQYRQTVINNLPCIASIDSIDTSNMLENKKIKVTGFAIAGPGISNLNLYIGGKLKASLSKGFSRQDLKISYPLYNTDAAGFSEEIDVSDLEEKEQEIKLVCTMKNGQMYQLSNKFLLEKKPPLSDEELKKIENTLSIVLDDDLYRSYSDYLLKKVINKSDFVVIQMIEEMKKDLQDKGYNPIIISRSLDNEVNYEKNINTVKDRAKIYIDGNALDSSENFKIGKSDDNYEKIVQNIVFDFVKCDNDFNLPRIKTFNIYNSAFSQIKINYNIEKKNTFNDTKGNKSDKKTNSPFILHEK